MYIRLPTKKYCTNAYDEIEWVEEGLRAPLWTALLLHSSVALDEVSSRYQEQIEQWSVGECLDATELAWSIGLRYPDRKKDVIGVLSHLQKHSTFVQRVGPFKSSIFLTAKTASYHLE